MESNLYECRKKRCPRRGTIIELRHGDSLNCDTCGKRMVPVYMDGPGANGDTPPSKPTHSSAWPLGNHGWLKDAFEQKKHYTIWVKTEGKGTSLRDWYMCWCGFSTTDERKASNHDDPTFTYNRSNRNQLPIIQGGWTSSKEKAKPKEHVEDDWTCDPDVKGCPILAAPKLYIPYTMFNQWVWLAMRFDTEWIAYLKGEVITEEVEGNMVERGWRLISMDFPTQAVNGAHVEAADGEIGEGIIGSVHSHVGMKAYFSAEDEAHLNHPVEIVVNREGHLATKLRMKLECGRYSRVPASVKLVPVEGYAELEAALEAKMTKVQVGFKYAKPEHLPDKAEGPRLLPPPSDGVCVCGHPKHDDICAVDVGGGMGCGCVKYVAATPANDNINAGDWTAET